MPAAKIMIVDDEIDVIEYCKIVLSSKYELITESDSQNVFKLVQKEKPDLLIMDLRMPNIDGFKIFDLMKSSPETNKIPILFITASTKDEDLPDKFWQQTLGCDGFLTKPFSPQTLLDTVEKIFLKKFNKNKPVQGSGFM